MNYSFRLIVVIMSLAIISLNSFSQAVAEGEIKVHGELKQWHKVTLTIGGPTCQETATPNPFLDYKLTGIFSQGDLSYIVPGYFAADGSAAETSATEGNVWRIHFTPPTMGEWEYKIHFRSGADIAIEADIRAGNSVGTLDEATGTFTIAATDKEAPDFRSKGRLEYIGEHHLRFAGNGEWFLKAGTDSPENFLAYEDFDNTPRLGSEIKTWAAHQQDYNEGDSSWQNGKGTEIMGAINYLSSRGLNAFSFLTMNIGGDDKNVYPYVSPTSLTQFDCSKLDQWEIVFEHGQRMGMYLHFKTQETENEQLLDGGQVGKQRKLYYRELIARFGHHLALNWNLGEENGAYGTRNQTDAERIQMCQYFHDTDPYKNNIVVHTAPGSGSHNEIYTPLLGSKSELTGVSIQTGKSAVHTDTKTWVVKSDAASKKWVVANDEQGSPAEGVPDDNAGFVDQVRRDVLWGNLMSGGAGVEYYAGYETEESDLNGQNFRVREMNWRSCGNALFFFNRYVPFWEMIPDDNKTDIGWCLYKADSVYLVYLPVGGNPAVNLGSGTYNVRWYDPKNGGDLVEGSKNITGGGSRSIGNSPDTNHDWVALIEETNYVHPCNACNSYLPLIDVSISPGYIVFSEFGESEQLKSVFYPSVVKDDSVTWSSDNVAVATVSSSGLVTAIGDGKARITLTTNQGNKTSSINVVVGTQDVKMKYGPNYIVWEPEETISDLGLWVLRTPGDPKYMEGTRDIGPINEDYLEFTGNDKNGGTPTSPLVYTFTAPTTGEYSIVGRMLQNLEGAEWDKCNDVWIKMDGDFEAGSGTYSESILRSYTKFYGRGKDNWGSILSGDVNHVYMPFRYKLKEGEEYTLTMAGRAQRTCIDYLLLYETSIDIEKGEEVDLASRNPEKYRPPQTKCKSFPAIEMKYSDIEGFTDAQPDNKDGKDILQIADRGAWAAAQLIYEGTWGDAFFTVNAMLEKDGESSYRISINGEVIGEATNDRIYGTTIEDYSIQSHLINEESVRLNDGDTIRVEFNNATNGLVPEGDLTATSRGRWHSLDICTDGEFKFYGIRFLQEKFSVLKGSTLKPDLEISIPEGANSDLEWTSDDPSVAAVDITGLVTGISRGTTTITAYNTDQDYSASCDIQVYTIGPYPEGTPINIPEKIEAENFNLGGEGVGYHDNTSNNQGGKYRLEEGVDIENCAEGGFNIGYTSQGEWIAYTIKAQKSGNYYMDIRVASLSEQIKFHVEIDDVNVSGTITSPTTNGWQNWKTVRVEDIAIDAGEHELKVVYDGDNWNFNWLDISAVIPVTQIKFSVDSITLYEQGTHQLNAKIFPDDAYDKSIVWNSLNTDVATVTGSGTVNAINEGVAIVVAKSNDGDFTDSCVVTVLHKAVMVSGVSMNDCPETDMEIGSTYQLNATITPSNADNQTMLWSSSDTTIASVDTSGVVSALSDGSASIIAETKDGGFSDNCIINVISATSSNARIVSEQIKIYPNPVEESLYVQLFDSQNQKNIKIFNVFGQLVFQAETMDPFLEIDVQEIGSNGLYLIQVVAKEILNSSNFVIRNNR